ncbi:unnamed protein product [Rotaria sordida]|uniref:Uncharacterized protein n=1 Tax=Rotaria sordida TaxID=392033 RepID=A0A814YP20_9BILA|nr:unnamed protein product [Rotaria sordida]CAF1231764.1 unnamed protein product [Rotaria sordida]
MTKTDWDCANSFSSFPLDLDAHSDEWQRIDNIGTFGAGENPIDVTDDLISDENENINLHDITDDESENDSDGDIHFS